MVFYIKLVTASRLSKAELKEQKKKEKEQEKERILQEKEREKNEKERKKQEELRQKNRKKYFVKNFKVRICTYCILCVV